MKAKGTTLADVSGVSGVATVLMGLLFLCACSSESSFRRTDSGPTTAPLRSSSQASSTIQERPPLEVEYLGSDASDIVAEVNSFQNVKSCVAGVRQQIPNPLSDVLTDIGYGKAALDACHSIQALAEKSVDICRGLQVSAAKNGCERRFAMYYGEPDVCPREFGRLGRESLCIAVAMRDPSMCYGELSQAEVGLCRAIILQSERPCRVAHETARAAAVCTAEASRWWKVIPPSRPRPRLPVGFAPSLQVCAVESQSIEANRDGGTASADGDMAVQSAGEAEGCIENPELLRRGVVIGPEEELIIGGKTGLPIGPRLPVLELRLSLPVGALPEKRTFGTSGDRAWVDLRPDAIFPEGQECLTGEVILERLGLYRGAIISGSFELSLEAREDGVSEVRGSFLTFVRDVEGLEEEVPGD